MAIPGRLLTPPEDRGPLRVAFLATSLPVGGAERLLVELVGGLDRERFAPEIVCLKQPGVLGERLAGEVPLHSGLSACKWDVRVLPRLVKLLRRRRIDAVVTVGAGDKMFWGRLAARAAGVPVVVSALHSTGWPDSVGRLNRLLTPITDAFVAVAESHARHLIERESFPRRKVVAIANGVDLEIFRPLDDRTEIRGELDLPIDAPVCGIVAALRPEKHHELFLRVAALIRIQIPRSRFVIVGDGPQRRHLEELVSRWGLQDCIRFLGRRDDVPRVLNALDLFLLTSHNEASPVSILEAMACEIPCVATDVGSVSETVQHGITGLLTTPGDAERMCRRAMALLRDAERRRKMGAAARDWVLEHASVASMIRGYEDLLDELYRRRCPPGAPIAPASVEVPDPVVLAAEE